MNLTQYEQKVRELEKALRVFHKQLERSQKSREELETNNQKRELMLNRVIQEVESAKIELQKAKEAADAANHAKSDFLANMSHELRTPLNGILGYAQILRRDKTASAKQKDGIDIIYQCGSHLLTLINDILDISKIEARKLELLPKDFHFASFLTGIVEICRIKAEQKEIAFSYEALNRLPTAINTDEKRLRQVLINLLGNAIKFTDKGGVTFKVGVIGNGQQQLAQRERRSCRRETLIQGCLTISKIRFQVEDTGVGMTPKQLEKIFLPFEQVGEKSRMAEGTGLGLAISQQIVQMMGSELQVESTFEQGSKFWFDVDLAESTEWIELEKGNTVHNIIGYQGEKRKVLVVDDRWENRSVIINLLEPLGFELMEAVNGQEGLEKATVWHPNLIITDIVMPVLDGLEMTQRLRSALQDVVIIASSASVFNFDRQQSLKSGCNNFLPKPVQSQELLEQIRHNLQLLWIYEGVQELALEHTDAAVSSFVAPEASQLQVLYAAAQIGDITGVEQEALRLLQLNAQYLPFAHKLLQLAQSLDEEAIFKLVKQYI